MKAAVVVFPGTNCEHDVVRVITSLGAEAELVFHKQDSLAGFDGVVLPGGFAHGDYLRSGAIARFSPVMAAVGAAARKGLPVIGICNGFQILCEAGLLPGALIPNRDLRFICKPVDLIVRSTNSVLTRALTVGDILRVPLNSYEGNYFAAPEALDELEDRDRVILAYVDADGKVSTASSPNGSARGIAGVTNEVGNVAGLMPHPERASAEVLGSTDGLGLLRSFVASMEHANV